MLNDGGMISNDLEALCRWKEWCMTSSERSSSSVIVSFLSALAKERGLVERKKGEVGEGRSDFGLVRTHTDSQMRERGF